MVNTVKGDTLWRQICSEFEYIESNTKECIQPVLQYPKPESLDRDSFWKEYEESGFDKTIRHRYHITDKMLLKNYLRQIIKCKS